MLLALLVLAASSPATIGPTPVVSFPDASPTLRGVVSTKPQQFVGPKVLSDKVTVAADAGAAYAATGVPALADLGPCPTDGSGVLQWVRAMGWYACQLDGGWGQLGTGSVTPPASYVLREQYNFGPAAGGSAATRPTFTGDATLAYLFYVKPDCSVACVTDDTNTTCPGVTWNTPTAPTCRQTWTGDWALTDITDTKAWIATGITVTPPTLFAGDFSLSIFGYPTTKNGEFGMLFEAFDAASSGAWMRADNGAVNITWFEGTAFPSATIAQSSLNGFGLATAHRSGHVRNGNLNGGAESSDVTDALGTISPTATMTVGIGSNPQSSGQAMGGQWVWAAIYKAAKTPAQSSKTVLNAVGFASTQAGLSVKGTGTILCYDNSDGGQADCLNGLPFIDARGFRAVRGFNATSKWASDPLDLSTATAENSPGLVTNVKAGPLFELAHANEMDRIIDGSASNFCGYKGGNSWVSPASPGTQNYSIAAYLSVGDGGVSNKARLALTTNGAWASDGGTECDCDVSGLTNTPVLSSCTCTLSASGSPSIVQGHVWVGNAASDIGSLTVGHVRVGASTVIAPMALSNTAVGDFYSELDPTAWHSFAGGGKYEVVWTPLMSTSAPDWQNQSDTTYLHDASNAADGGSTHLVTFLYGYNTAGHFLGRFGNIAGALTDLTVDNVALVPGTTYATSMEWLGSGSCSLNARWNTCASTVPLCTGTTSQASASGGTCPDSPTDVKVPQRYDISVPTDAWILSIRSYSL